MKVSPSPCIAATGLEVATSIDLSLVFVCVCVCEGREGGSVDWADIHA